MKKKEQQVISKQEARRIRAIAVIKEVYRQGEFAKVTAFVNDFIRYYPDDPFGKYYYAKLLRRNGLVEEALDVLQGLAYERNFAFYLDIVKCHFDLGHFYRVIDMCEKCFEEDLTLTNQVFLRRAYVYAHKKLNLPIKMLEDADYMEKQLYHYDREVAIDMTKRKFNNSVCLYDFSLDSMFDYIEGLLSDSKYDPSLIRMEDFYYFHCPNVGQNQGQICDYLRVETIYGTNQIVNLYPIHELSVRSRAIVNECPVFLEGKSDLTRVSQIDKFHKKYGAYVKAWK